MTVYKYLRLAEAYIYEIDDAKKGYLRCFDQCPDIFHCTGWLAYKCTIKSECFNCSSKHTDATSACCHILLRSRLKQ